VDGLACPMRRPTACSSQTRGQGFLPDAILSRHAAMGGGALLGDTQPPGLDIEVFDCLGTCVIEFYIERIAFYQDIFTSCLTALQGEIVSVPV
jgi:hypothetical protein